MGNTEKIWELVDIRKDAYEALSDRVWEMPELAYGEHRSAAEHRGMMGEVTPERARAMKAILLKALSR